MTDTLTQLIAKLREKVEFGLLGKVQLNQVDEVLSRRPVLDDCKTRYEKIERCISTAKQVDQLRTTRDETMKWLRRSIIENVDKGRCWCCGQHYAHGAGCPLDTYLSAHPKDKS